MVVECRRVGLKINININEVSEVIKRKNQCVHVRMGDQAVKQFRSFQYFGSSVNENCRNDAEISSRIAMTGTTREWLAMVRKSQGSE